MEWLAQRLIQDYRHLFLQSLMVCLCQFIIAQRPPFLTWRAEIKEEEDRREKQIRRPQNQEAPRSHHRQIAILPDLSTHRIRGPELDRIQGRFPENGRAEATKRERRRRWFPPLSIIGRSDDSEKPYLQCNDLNTLRREFVYSSPAHTSKHTLVYIQANHLLTNARIMTSNVF